MRYYDVSTNDQIVVAVDRRQRTAAYYAHESCTARNVDRWEAVSTNWGKNSSQYYPPNLGKGMLTCKFCNKYFNVTEEAPNVVELNHFL